MYRRVVAEHPDNHVAWNSLGAIEARRGRLASAREHYRRALALNPNYATARANLEAAERGLERARRFLAAPAPPADGDAELRRLRAGACRAVGDVDCEDAARVLAERPERVRAPRSRATPDAR